MPLADRSPEVSPVEVRPGQPRTVFVTGPPGAGKTRWLQARIRVLRETRAELRCAVLSVEEGRTRMEEFVRNEPGVTFGKLVMPCMCCPALAGLPRAASEMVRATAAEFLFVEVPAVAVAGLLQEFDQALAWPREVVLCLDRRWATLRARPELPYFHAGVIALADVIVPPEPIATSPAAPTTPDAPSLTL